MPAKTKITKEDIIQAAVASVREKGESSINARSIAAALNCSTQPIFSNFASMQDLRIAVVERADKLCEEYMKREVELAVYPTYKAMGMAYIRFAKEEKRLFQLLYMRDRSEEVIPNETAQTVNVVNVIRNATGLDEDLAKLFQLEMWAYVHGVASMYATGFLNLEWDLVSKMLTDAYLGLRKQYGME